MSNRADTFNRTGPVVLAGATPSDSGSVWIDPLSSFLTGLDTGSGEVVCYDGTPSTTNYAVLECSVTDHEATAEVIRQDDNSGVIGRYVDTSNHYFFRSTGFGGGVTELWKVVASSFTKLADGSISFTPGLGNTLSIRCVGATIKGYVNGVQAASVTDTDLTTGTKAGIYTRNASQFFNSFSITDMAAPAVAAPISLFHSSARTRASNY